jgi:hypothetical protein
MIYGKHIISLLRPLKIIITGSHMSKKLVSEQEIVEWINSRLQEEYDGDFSIKHITRLLEFNHNGCNWSDTVVVRNGTAPGIRQIIDEAQSLFNLKIA